MPNNGKNRKDNKGKVLPPNVSQLSDLRYIWRKTIDGKPYVLVDSDLAELKKKIIQKKADIQNNVCRDISKSTLNQWFDKWIELYKGNLKAVTKRNYKKYWKWYVRDSDIGKMKIGKIKRIQIVELYKNLSGKGLAYGTIKYINSLLDSCFADAVSDKLLTGNPCDDALGKIAKTEEKKREALTLEQQALFINFIAESSTYNIYLPLFSFLLGTGCRLGEATGITWSDINFKENIISVNHTLSYKDVGDGHKFFITSPKTKSSIRDIPMIEDLKKQLLKQKEYQFELSTPRDYEVDGYKGFVFTTRYGKPFTQEAVNRTIRYIIKACNEKEAEKAKKEDREPVILPSFSAHVLRHTFCTRFCENESNVKVIQKIMGHSRINTTLDIYTHVNQDKSGEIMNKLNGKIKIS